MGVYEFARLVHELRRRRGLSHAGLAALADVSKKTVLNWEAPARGETFGEINPRFETAARLAAALGVTPETLYQAWLTPIGEDSSTRPEPGDYGASAPEPATARELELLAWAGLRQFRSADPVMRHAA